MNNTKSLLGPKNFQRIIPFAVFLFVTAPIVVLAATPLVQCDGSAAHPCDFNALAALVNNIINWFLGISVSVAAITFAIAGAKILFNPEKEAERTAAKDMFVKTAIGLVIILVAWLVIHTVIAALTNNPSSGVGPLKFLGN